MEMPPFILGKPRKHRKRAMISSPQGLGLSAAEYSPGELTLTLRFNQDVDLNLFDSSLITVFDGTNNHNQYIGAAAIDYGNNWITFQLAETDPDSGTVCVMNAPSNTGIIAMSDGEPWGGVTGFVLAIV